MKISRRQFLQGLAATAVVTAMRRLPGIEAALVVPPVPVEEIGISEPLYVALHGKDGEIDAPSYARQPGHWGETVFFPQASSDWGVVTEVAIFNECGILLCRIGDRPAKYICCGDTVAVILDDDLKEGM